MGKLTEKYLSFVTKQKSRSLHITISSRLIEHGESSKSLKLLILESINSATSRINIRYSLADVILQCNRAQFPLLWIILQLPIN